ncbi:MAG: hypothetical protein DRJ38_07575 [Thermoprotei archaeon]|nr:MAG: hypothetical protein DRJ38_07575 [Thermoprotei archaeon]
MNVIEVENVWWTYKGREEPVLKNVNLRVEKGEFLGIMGPSSVGKTTLCLTFTGIIPQRVPGLFKGNVRVLGLDVKEIDVTELTRRVGVVFEDPESQFIMSTVEDELVIGLEPLNLSREEIRDRILWALDLVGLDKSFLNRSPLQLSGGEKQRVAIAAMLAKEPEILVLDEPTSDLDPLGKEEVLNVIKRIRDELDITIVVVEHESEILAELADRLVLLYDGKVVLEGSPKEFFSEVPKLISIGVYPPQITQLFYQLGRNSPPITLSEALKYEVLKLKKAVMEARPIKGVGDIIVECRNVSFSYEEDKFALKNVNLKIRLGEYIGLVGPNGSGKTTLAKIIAGLLKPSKGIVYINGKRIEEYDKLTLSSLVGYVFQNPDHQLFNQTVWDEVAFGLKLRGLSGDELESRVRRTLEIVGLQELAEEHPFFLSKGEKRRLALASILALEPKVLIVDEPTTGQDRGFSYRILSLLNDMRNRGITVIVITHSIPQLVKYADRLIVLKNGVVLADGNPREILADGSLVEEAKLTVPQVSVFMQKLGVSPIPLTVEEALNILE